ncbi:MAG: hypothetical protein GTO40_29155, partial [Deltaproteobacteria bacterium]|nr:hypothetical protein [Deltaproteobacteria bacterium]
IFEFNGVANVREEDSITRMFTANFNIGFDDLKLPGPGTYEIVFLHQEQEFHTVPLVAIRVTPPTLQ